MAEELTTAQDVQAAEKEAADTAAHVESLLGRVRTGDASVTPEEVHLARQAAEFAELRVEHIRNLFKQAEEARYLAACQAKREDIETALGGTVRGDGTAIVEALRAFRDAAVQVAEAFHAHNGQVDKWRDEIRRLGVPEHRGPFVPHDDHAGIGTLADGTVVVGRRRLNRLNIDIWLGRALMDAQREVQTGKPGAARLAFAANGLYQPFVPTMPERFEDVYADLARVFAPRDLDVPQHFYRGPGGAVIERDRPYTDEEIADQRLTVISPKEAYGS